MPTITKRIWDPVTKAWKNVSASTGSTVQDTVNESQETLADSGQAAVNQSNAQNPDAGATAPQGFLDYLNTDRTNTMVNENTGTIRKTTNLGDVVEGKGSQKIDTYQDGVKSGTDFRYKSFIQGGKIFAFDESGNLVDTGKIDIQSTNIHGDIVADPNEVIGIDADGNRFMVGETSADRPEIQDNVVMGANSGGDTNRSDVFADLRASTQAGGRAERTTGQAPSGYTDQFGNFISNELSGFDKQQKYRAAGLLPTETATADELINYDFIGDEFLSNYFESAGGAPDRADYGSNIEYDLARTQWEAETAKRAAEEMRVTANQQYAENEKKAWRSAIQDTNAKRNAKSLEQVQSEMAELNKNLMNQAVSAYDSKRKDVMAANIESRTANLSGSTKAVALAKAQIEKEEKEAYERDVASAKSRARYDTDEFVRNSKKELAAAHSEALAQAEAFASMSPTEAAAAQSAQEQDELVANLTGVMSPITQQPITTEQATAMASQIQKAFPFDKQRQSGFVDFMSTMGSGAINTMDASSVFGTAATAATGGNGYDATAGNKYLEVLAGKELAKEIRETAAGSESGVSTKESSVTERQAQFQTSMLKGEADPLAMRSFMANIEAEDTGKAGNIYGQMVSLGSYKDDPVTSAFLAERLSNYTGEDSVDLLLLQPGVYGIPTQLINSNVEREAFNDFVRDRAAKGYDMYGIRDEFLGFIINKDDDKPFADQMRSLLSTSEITKDTDYANMARDINAGNLSRAVDRMEKRVLGDVDQGFKDSTLARDTVMKSQNILERINSGNVDLSLVGTLDAKTGRVRMLQPEEDIAPKDLQRYRETQRLAADLVALMAPYRKDNIGSQVTEPELALLRPIMADMEDQPYQMKEKIGALVDTVMQSYNATRDTAGLPMLTAEQLMDDAAHVGVYTNVINESPVFTTSAERGTKTTFSARDLSAAGISRFTEDITALTIDQQTEFGRKFNANPVGVKNALNNGYSAAQIAEEGRQNDGAATVDRNTQCGAYVNDTLGLGDTERLGDSLASKTDGESFVAGADPTEGSYFVMDTGSAFGHAGLVTSVIEEGIFIRDRNRMGDGKEMTTFIPYNSDLYKKIIGYGNGK